jgi:hypothetical protein
VRTKIAVAPLIPREVRVLGMLTAIKFDNEPMAAAEISDIGADPDLPPEMRALEQELPTEIPPQLLLRFRGVAAEMRCKLLRAGRGFPIRTPRPRSTLPHPHPLPL